MVKRKQEESDYYREILAGLLETLRSSPSTHITRLIELIRNNASLDQIAAFVKEILEELRRDEQGSSREAQQLRELQRELSQRPQESSIPRRRRIESLENLCDVPLHQVPAKPWTTVTDDDEMVSHLISLYFTWEHPFRNYIDKEVFLSAMASRDQMFCSSLLVNAICAQGCASFPTSHFLLSRDSNR